MLGAELERPPAWFALEVRHVEPGATVGAALVLPFGGQIVIAVEQKVVESDIGKDLRVQGRHPSIRTDPDGQAWT